MTDDQFHPSFPQPADENAAIWRYLTPSKFQWMIEEGRLFMPLAGRLGDPLEGTRPQGDCDWWVSHAQHAPSKEVEEVIKHNSEFIEEFGNAFRAHYYVSCWHMNENVNPTMWESYAGNTDSIAVKTTFAKLRGMLPAYVFIGMVRYIDFSTQKLPTMNLLDYITHKNESFAAEQELRAVAMRPFVEGTDHDDFFTNYFQSDSDESFTIYAPKIKFSELIDNVYVHPSASNEYFQRVNLLCEKYGIPRACRARW